MSSLITLDHAWYRYPGREAEGEAESDSWALRDVSLTVESGELVGIVGRNGAGKSTLCLTLNGLVPHFFHGDLKGDVVVAGSSTRSVTVPALIKHVGVLFQNPFEQLTGVTDTVREEVAFGPENLGVPRDEVESRVDRALASAGIDRLSERHPFELSGGQQQRVALAAVLAMEPSILVLDEPTSQLDPVGSDEVFEVIGRMHRSGYTILVAEHKIEALAEVATRIVVLAHGKVVMDGSPRQVLTKRELLEFDVQPPRYTTLGQRLADRGLRSKGEEPLTLDEAARMVSDLLGQDHA
ncbi:MAG TPA: ABC transporter ATP-binding protein [Candidatus Limnocylindria bacterium]|nr:ABC transporter ATP-binding protein [Candidatus Limnocylindria bacterium]